MLRRSRLDFEATNTNCQRCNTQTMALNKTNSIIACDMVTDIDTDRTKRLDSNKRLDSRGFERA